MSDVANEHVSRRHRARVTNAGGERMEITFSESAGASSPAWTASTTAMRRRLRDGDGASINTVVTVCAGAERANELIVEN
jgi:hypothetical protein